MTEHFYVAIEFGQEKRILCRGGYFYVAPESSQEQGALCCDIAFCVVTELVKVRSFYVTTEFGLGQGVCVATEYLML